MNCFMIKQPPLVTVSVVYVFVPGESEHARFATRFVRSYRECRPEFPHNLIVVCNGRKMSPGEVDIFKPLKDYATFQHNDQGWDIGAFIEVAKTLSTDMMVCFGGPGYVRRPEWLERMVQAWMKHGPGVYGSLSTFEVRPHLNTCGFWCPPKLLADYPVIVSSKQDRYTFEHGERAFWRIALDAGYPVKLVTWDGEYDWPDWRKPPNIYRRGDQSNCLTFFRHTDNYERTSNEGRATMERLADTMTDPLFKTLIKKHQDSSESKTSIRDLFNYGSNAIEKLVELTNPS